MVRCVFFSFFFLFFFFFKKKVGPADARPFFSQFGLPGPTLVHIWKEANAAQTEALSREDFFVALRLVALAQSGLPVSRESALASRESLVPRAVDRWVLAPQQVASFLGVFQGAAGADNHVTGAAARELFLSYGLPVADLKSIWELSDADKDEKLSRAEFLVAMYLIYRKKQNDALPKELPSELVASAAAAAAEEAAPAVVSFSPTAEEKEWYARVFREADTDSDGAVSAEDCRAVFTRSGLERPLLRRVWELVDVRKSDHLNAAEFAAGMHLIACALKGASLPDTLPASLELPRPPLSSSSSSSLPLSSPAAPRLASSSSSLSRPSPSSSSSSPAPGGLLGAVREAQSAAAAAQSEAASAREQLAAARERLAAEQRAAAEQRTAAVAKLTAALEKQIGEEKERLAEAASVASALAAAVSAEHRTLQLLADELSSLRAQSAALQREAAQHAAALTEAQKSVAEAQKELSQLRAGVVASANSLSASAGGAIGMIAYNPFAD